MLCKAKMPILFFGLLENYMFAQYGAVFLELYLTLDFLLVFASPIGLTGRLVLELYQLIL